MKSHILESRLTAPVSIGEAFAVFEDPYNLARITPPWLNFEITSPDQVEMRKGAIITYRIRWMGIPLRWKTRIAEYAPPFYFVDEQAAGPYVLWRHEHRFTPSEEGTLVTDRVEYSLPFGWLGWLMHGLMVRRQLDGIFEFRRRALAEMWRELGGTPGPPHNPTARAAT
jgi:ligand-binding SRPBCC domain-containing protein